MSQNNVELSIVLPSYLEAENLRLLLPRVKRTVEEIGCNFEILIIDTMEALDTTEEACKEYGATYIKRKGGNTYGHAIITGINMAQGKYTIFMDADGSHSPEFIKKLFAKKGDKTIVIASRYTDGGYTENNKSQVFMSKTLNVIYSIVLSLPYKDISNSYKLYDTKLLKSIHLRCKNFDIVEEIIYKIVRQNKSINVIELPYSFKKRMFGETKRNLFAFILGFVITLINLKLSVYSIHK